MTRKGIILAGGSGTRLYPLTISVSKQLMPIYDKPTIYYPLATLMQGNVRDILIITTPSDVDLFKKLLGDGSDFGINLSYAVQREPRGLAEAYIIAEDFLDNSSSVMILGDNFFHGDKRFNSVLEQACNVSSNNCIFAKRVTNPNQYGVVEFSLYDSSIIKSLEEKPLHPKSNYAVPGIYFFDETAPERAKALAPSRRGELEIIELCKSYITTLTLSLNVSHGANSLRDLYVYDTLDDVAWLDTGTHQGLLDAAQYVKIIEDRHDYKIACLEEIALEKGWVSPLEMRQIVQSKGLSSSYYKYINSLLLFKYGIDPLYADINK